MSATQVTGKLRPPVGDQDHSLGPANAPVTLVEFGDFECPHCGAVHSILKEIRLAMGKDLHFAFRHFPLTQVHPNAEMAAEAAEAAGAQHKFWEMHDLLFTHQNQLDEKYLLGFARQLQLDVGRFGRELEEHFYLDRVRENFRSGVVSGVNGTPTFFINGFRYDGSREFAPLLHALESVRDSAA